MPILASSSSVNVLGSGWGIAAQETQISFCMRGHYRQGNCGGGEGDLRRFLFHTAAPSGAGRPVWDSEDLEASRKPLAALATSLGFGVVEVLGGAAEATEVGALSPTLGAFAFDVTLDARKVLLTETDLKVAGFLTEEVLEWPLSSFFEMSGFEASVSEPPLMLTSAELTTSSTMSWTNLSTTALDESPPFTSPDAAAAAGASAEEISGASTLPSSVCVLLRVRKRHNVCEDTGSKGGGRGNLRAKQESQFLRRTGVA